MTEKEWKKSARPWPMFEYLGQRASDRKLRLYVCACCQRVSHLTSDKRFARLLRTLEKVAEDRVKDTTRQRALAQSHNAKRSAPDNTHACLFNAIEIALTSPIDRVFIDPGEPTRSAIYHAGGQSTDAAQATNAETARHATFIRDIFGNPFRPVAFSPSWRTDTAVSLARQMYDSREFGAMPILADALQDAGCDNDDILAHCRDPQQTHVRGCWVVDLVLGKS